MLALKRVVDNFRALHSGDTSVTTDNVISDL